MKGWGLAMELSWSGLGVRVTLGTCHVNPRVIVTCHVCSAGATGWDDGGEVGLGLENVHSRSRRGGLSGQGGHGAGGEAGHDAPLTLHRDIDHRGVTRHDILVTCHGILVTSLSGVALIHAGLTDTACNSKNVIYGDKTSRNFELKYSKRQFSAHKKCFMLRDENFLGIFINEEFLLTHDRIIILKIAPLRSLIRRDL